MGGAAVAACSDAPPAPQAEPAKPATQEQPASREHAGHITLEATDIAPSALLRRLALQEGFLLIGAPEDDRPVRVRIESARLEQVLAQLLRGEAYALHYAVDASGQGHRLAQVVVGSAEAASASGSASALPLDEAALREQLARLTGTSPDAELPLAGDEVPPAAGSTASNPFAALLGSVPLLDDDDAASEELASDDPDERADGVRMLDPDGAVQRLAHYATTDAAPQVRAAAIETLAGSEVPAASAPIFAALEDDDVDVILAALDALAFRRDPGARERIEPLLRHPNPEVQLEAEGTLEFLE